MNTCSTDFKSDASTDSAMLAIKKFRCQLHAVKIQPTTFPTQRCWEWGMRGSNSPQPNYEFGAFTRLLIPLIGVLGVEPRLTRYKQAALTIKLYSQKIMMRRRDLYVFVIFLYLPLSLLPCFLRLSPLYAPHLRLWRAVRPNFLANVAQ